MARILVVDGYPKTVRDQIAAAGGEAGGDLYAAMLRGLRPNLATDIVCAADADAALPEGAALEDYDGIAWTGSSLNLYNGGPEIERQIELMRAGYRAGVPMFGSCWALQVAAAAAGGSVIANPLGRELGIARKIALTADGAGHPLFAGKSGPFDAVCIHRDIVDRLPPDCTVLAANAVAGVQAAAIRHEGGEFWGVQYHPEFDLREIGRIIRRYGDTMIAEGFFSDRPALEAWAAELEALQDDPSRRDLAWKHGLDADVLDPERRLAEPRNWLERRVFAD